MDQSSIIQLIVLIILLILSGFFSSAETALTTVNKISLMALANDGSKKAKHTLKVIENSSKLLSTILIGNNIVNISASALATTLCTKLFGSAIVGISTGILTLIILVFGEVTPKTLAKKYSTELAQIFSYPIGLLMLVLTPFVWLLNLITGIIFHILRIDPNDDGNTITESELRTIVDVSHEEGVIEKEERQMIANVVDFGDTLSKDIMIPRTDVICGDVYMSFEEIVKLFGEEKFSRIPIYENAKDNVIGILYIKDLFFYSQTFDMEYFDLRSILRKPLFVYEYEKTSEIFSEMKTSSISMAVVLDEYGKMAGIITMEDLIEEIVGDIRDEYDEDEATDLIKLDEKTYDIDASIKLGDLSDKLGIRIGEDDYDSLAGFVIEVLDRLPEEGDKATYENFEFLVTKINKNRIERITLSINDIQENEKDEE